MKLVKLISVVNTGHIYGCPEWRAIVETESGQRVKLERIVQWNEPQLHHIQDTATRFPSLFVTA